MQRRGIGRATWLMRLGAAAVVLLVVVAVLVIALRPDANGDAAFRESVAPSVASAAPSAPSVAPSPEASSPVAAPGPRTGGYLTNLDELRARAAMAADGVEPYASAVDQLLSWADDALDEQPQPDQSLRITGTKGPFLDDTSAAYGLALAFAISGNEQYADHARTTIMAWVDTTTELRNACPDGGECQTSLIVARVVPGFVFAADLLEQTGAWDPADRAALSAWLENLILPILPVLPNNWGDAGNFAEVALADYVGDSARFDAGIERWRDRLEGIAADGHLPEETRRGDNGIMYTQEALVYKVAIAAMAERRGIDLWDAVNPSDVGLRDALDYLVRYWDEPEAWPWDDRAEIPSAGPLWEIAYAHWCDPAYLRLAEQNRPYGFEGNSAVRWTTLTAANAGDICQP